MRHTKTKGACGNGAGLRSPGLWAVSCILAAAALCGAASGDQVEIWNGGIFNWTTTFADGTPVDCSPGGRAYEADMAADPSGRIYLICGTWDGGSMLHKIYLHRYDGSGLYAWGAGGWTAALSGGIPINPGVAPAYPWITWLNMPASCLAIDQSGTVYMAYSSGGGIYLGRYDDATGVRIWDGSGWSPNSASGAPISAGSDNYGQQVAIDAGGTVYVTYSRDGEVMLCRYDGTDVRGWSPSGWTTDFADAVCINWDICCDQPQIAVDPWGAVYIALASSTYMHGLVELNKHQGNTMYVWGGSGWTTNLGAGARLDRGAYGDGEYHLDDPARVAIDSNGVVYVTYSHYWNRFSINYDSWDIMLNRCDGNSMEIWDGSGWSTTMTDGAPLNPGRYAGSPRIAIDPYDNVYVAHSVGTGAPGVYLNRCDGSGVRIWSSSGWSAAPSNGASIAPAGGGLGDLATDAGGRVYVGCGSYGNFGRRLVRYDGGMSVWGSSGWTASLGSGMAINPPVISGSYAMCGVGERLVPDWSGRVYMAYNHWYQGAQRLCLDRYVPVVSTPTPTPWPTAAAGTFASKSTPTPTRTPWPTAAAGTFASKSTPTPTRTPWPTAAAGIFASKSTPTPTRTPTRTPTPTRPPTETPTPTPAVKGAVSIRP